MAEDLGSAAKESGTVTRIPFSLAQESRIRSLASWLEFLGWAYLVLTAFDIITMVASRSIGPLFSALLKVIIGTWALQAARAFRTVATTDVADQDYLVLGFRKLRSIFLLQSILVIVSLALVFSVFMIIFLLGMTTRH
jgi:hypothetical protein